MMKTEHIAMRMQATHHLAVAVMMKVTAMILVEDQSIGPVANVTINQSVKHRDEAGIQVPVLTEVKQVQTVTHGDEVPKVQRAG
jgi:hypothetical protein